MILPNPNIKDLTGKRFGRLTVISFAETRKRSAHWLCRCDCGNEKVIKRYSLVSGATKSCGCSQKEIAADMVIKRSTTHGLSNSRTYQIWQCMIRRCHNPKNIGYANYGGRGIKVCPRWMTFENFFADMGHVPEGLSLGRLDNDGPYCPENARWETRTQQARNTRRNRLITHQDHSLTIPEWAEKTGLSKGAITTRLDHLKWSIDRALKIPSGKNCKHLTWNGKTLTIAEWSQETGLGESAIRVRINRGWSTERALTEPIHTEKRTKAYSAHHPEHR